MNSALRKSAQNPSPDWFLISGDLSVRLNRPVTLGVDANGIIQLNAKDAGVRWLTLGVAPSGDGIVIVWQDSAIELRSNGTSLDPDTLFEPGTLIQLPNNDVYLGRSLLRGKSLRTIEVIRTRQRKVRTDASEPVKTALETPIGPVPEVPAKAQREAPSVPVRAAAIRAAKAKPHSQTPERRWGLGLAAVVLVGAGVVGWQQRDLLSAGLSAADQPLTTAQSVTTDPSSTPAQVSMPAQPDVEGPPEQPALDPEAAVASTPQAADSTTEELTTAQTPAPQAEAEAEVTPQTETVAQAEPEPTTSAMLTQAEPEPPTSALLTQAEQLFAQGYYTWPEPNAATLIDQILGMDPEHGGALELRDRMATLLLDEARAAYDEGFPGAARDQVKAVLAFHRNHGPAVELLIAWDEARLARRIASRS